MFVNRQYKQGHSPCLGQAAWVCLLVVAQSAFANPTGGTVTAGNASIVSQGPTTTITQTSAKAIINWGDFSISPNEMTEFKQPSASSVTLNRVTGGNPSQILGTLKANGNVYLINPNGILFGKNAHVDVGGLVASTSQITDKEFLSGQAQHFTPGNAGASVINEGTITVRNAGLAVLVSPTVVNSGVIQADLGTVQIASADHFTLDPYGDHLITFDAGKQLTEGLIENEGTIRANGGKVYLTAQAADSMLENIVNMDGYIEATSVSNHNGTVVLQGYDNSQINVNGQINVSSLYNSAGIVQVSADKVYLGKDSVINASGYGGGGTVNIGGEYQGSGTLRHAMDVVMDSGAMINADAMHSGKGGTVTLWSDENTDAHGSIFARGGEISGDGGLIETSSHNQLDVGGITVNTSATQGHTGLWLIDPVTLQITDSTSGAGLLAATTINANLLTTNYNISTTDGIEFDNVTIPISWGNGNTLSVRSNAGGSSIAADPDTITYNGGCGAGCLIQATGAGNVDFFYNPANNPVPYDTPTSFPKVSVNTGTFNAYMLVNTVAELNLVGFDAITVGQNYALNNNLSVGAFTSIGGQGSGLNFTGKFTGNIQGTQYTLSNITIAGGGNDQVGLFGSVVGGTLDNITVDNINVSGHDYIGGIAGALDGTTLTGSFNVLATVASSVTSSRFDPGGLFGRIRGVNTSADMTNYATVTGGDSQAGGIIANIRTGAASSLSGTLSNFGSVSATTFNAGGIVGLNEGGVISGTIIVGNGITPITIGGPAQGVGYVIGNNRFVGSDLTSLSVTVASNVSLGGVGAVGGIIGGLGQGASFTGLGSLGAVYTIPTVSNPTADFVGGVIGVLYDGTTLPSNLHAIANVVGHDNVGGVIGGSFIFFTVLPNTITGTLSNSGFTVTGRNSVGGVLGLASEVTLDGTMTSNATVISTGTGAGGVVGTFAGTNSVMGANALFTTTGGSVSGVNSVGGLVGNLSPVTYSGSNVGNFSNAASVTASGNGAGGFFGSESMAFQSINTNFSNSGTIIGLTSATGVGGLAGTIDNLSMDGNYINTGNVSGADNVGGLIGLETNSSLVFSAVLQSTGTISGVNKVGGLFGEVNNSILTGLLAFNSGNVIGTGASVGGIIGQVDSTATLGVTGSFITQSSNISGATAVGGVVGLNNATLHQAEFLSGTVSGTSQVGGVVGTNGGFGSLTESLLVAGTVSGTGTDIGGVIGHNVGVVSDVSFGGTLSAGGANNVGGLVGLNDNTVQFGLMTGTVTGGTNVGALVGNNGLTGILQNSIYNADVNAGLGSTGINTGTIANLLAGTYASLSIFSTYTDQGFNPLLWQLVSGNYASLIWCGSSCYIADPFTPPTPPSIPTTTQSIQTQINNAQTFMDSQSVVYGVAEWLASTGLNIIAGSSVMDQMNISSDSPYYNDVRDFMAGTTVLQWLDDSLTTMSSDQVQTYSVGAVQDAVQTQQTVMGCAVN